MKRRFKLSIICLMCLIMSSISASAGNYYSVSYDGGGAVFCVAGKSPILKANQIILLQVINENKSVDELYKSPASNAEEIIAYTIPVMTDSNGNYLFQFRLQTKGYYIIRISQDGILLPELQVYRSTQEEINSVLAQINVGVDVGSVILGNYHILQVDESEFKTYQTNPVFLNNLTKKKYLTLPEFLGGYNESVLLVKLSSAKDAGEIEALLKERAKEVSFAGKHAYEVFTAYTKAAQLKAYKHMVGYPYESLEDVQNVFYESVILNEFSESGNYKSYFQVIEDNNDVIGLDLTKYKNLDTYIEAFQKELVSAQSISLTDLKIAYDNLYNKYLRLLQDGKNDSKNIGGGKSSYANVDNTLIPEIKQLHSSYFEDIESVEWARTAIEQLSSKGIVSGKDRYIFAPLDSITRAEYIKILIGAFGLTDDSAETTFEDVPKTLWSYPFIATAKIRGIANGISNVRFGADESITRQDMITLCFRLLKSLNITMSAEGKLDFQDKDMISDYAKTAVLVFRDMGVVKGKDNNMFEPFSFATRAEAAKMIYEVLQLKQ